MADTPHFLPPQLPLGDLSRADSGLHYQRETRRHYALLEELNTRPRTTYLAALEDGLPADETPEGRSDG